MFKHKVIEHKEGHPAQAGWFFLYKRLLNRVNKTNSCWLWNGAKNRNNGYGRIKISGNVKSTHRLSYKLFKGKIPKGMLVCHSCDIKSCVNPNHLFLGTHSDNLRDAFKKGIASNNGIPFGRGENHPSHKLTQKQALFIKSNHKNFTYLSLGNKFGVDKSAIYRVIKGKTWAWL